MKTSIAILALLVLLVSCDTNKKYLINGSIIGELNEEWIYIEKFYGTKYQMDSARLIDGKFRIEGSVDYPELYFLHNHPDRNKGLFAFYLEPGIMDIVVDAENWNLKTKISGGFVNSEYNEIIREPGISFINKVNDLLQQKTHADINESVELDRTINELMDELKYFELEYVSTNPDSPISPFLLARHFNNIPIDTAGILLEGFSSDVKQTSIYLKLFEQYSKIK